MKIHLHTYISRYISSIYFRICIYVTKDIPRTMKEKAIKIGEKKFFHKKKIYNKKCYNVLYVLIRIRYTLTLYVKLLIWIGVYIVVMLILTHITHYITFISNKNMLVMLLLHPGPIRKTAHKYLLIFFFVFLL